MGPSLLRRAFALWLPVAAATSVLAFTVYAGVQQSQRAAANDSQLQMARDAAAALHAGSPAVELVVHPTIDVTTSDAPWLVIYDPDGAIRASSGTFDGQPPQVPDGVITDVRWRELVFSWEPRDGLRFATVAVPYHGGIVVAARSLAEIEERENRTLAIAGVGWLAGLGAAAVAAGLGVWIRDRGLQQPH